MKDSYNKYVNKIENILHRKSKLNLPHGPPWNQRISLCIYHARFTILAPQYHSHTCLLLITTKSQSKRIIQWWKPWHSMALPWPSFSYLVLPHLIYITTSLLSVSPFFFSFFFLVLNFRLRRFLFLKIDHQKNDHPYV